MDHLLRSILVATDLGSGSDMVVRSAARLASRIGADLHLLHALERSERPFWDAASRTTFEQPIAEAERRLQAQARRAMPEDLHPASQQVAVYAAHRAIEEHAARVGADLIVIGRNRADAAETHFLGTTADRVIRAAASPCLVIGAPLAERIRRIGVPIDYSDPSPGALEVALAWGRQAVGGDEAEQRAGPEIRVMHAGWIVERVHDSEREARVLRPALEQLVERVRARVPGSEALDVGVEVIWGNDPTEDTVLWAIRERIDLLVVATHGSTGVRRMLLGSTASSVARQASCPVLLVPPALWSGGSSAPRLQRLLVATDFRASAVKTARWSTRHLAPDAEHLLVHVLEVPEPPAVVTGRYGSREELLRTAREGVRQRLEEQRQALEAAPRDDGAHAVRTVMREGQPADEMTRVAEASDVDLIVMGGDRRDDRKRSTWTMLGTTAERVLRAAPTPVLIGRGPLQGPPGNLLVAVDGSEPSRHALAWAGFLRRRFGGTLTAIHVEAPFLFEYGDLLPTSTELAALAAQEAAEQPGWLRARTRWLQDEVRRANIDPDATTLRVAIGKPADEIAAEQERCGADLVLMGTHGHGALARALLGSVASAVLRAVPCSVLVAGASKKMSARTA